MREVVERSAVVGTVAVLFFFLLLHQRASLRHWCSSLWPRFYWSTFSRHCRLHSLSSVASKATTARGPRYRSARSTPITPAPRQAPASTAQDPPRLPVASVKGPVERWRGLWHESRLRRCAALLAAPFLDKPCRDLAGLTELFPSCAPPPRATRAHIPPVTVVVVGVAARGRWAAKRSLGRQRKAGRQAAGTGTCG